MFQVNHSSLRAKVKKAKLAPAFILWENASRGMGVLLEVDIYANWGKNINWGINSIDLTSPLAVGEYCRLDLGFSVSSVMIPGYAQADDAITAQTNQFWVEGTIIHFYKFYPIPTEIVVEIAATPTLIADYTYTITVPESFSASSILAAGLTFTLSSSLAPGTFTQSDTTITVYGSPAYRLELGQSVTVAGIFNFDTPSPILAIASFGLEIDYLDYVEWVGKNFTPANISDIKSLNFIWDGGSKIAKLFLDTHLLPAITPPTQFSNNLQSSSEVTFLR